MKLIVGLGNPGLKYSNTRHNIGFKTVKLLARNYDIKIDNNEFGAKTGAGVIAGNKTILVLPQKFMNLSGEPLKAITSYYKIKNEDLLVVCDDVNILTGVLRLRRQGSAGGHNGLKSIIAHLGTDCFSRLRIGVGRVGLKGDITGYVLGKFIAHEQKMLPEILSKAIEACENWIREGKVC